MVHRSRARLPLPFALGCLLVAGSCSTPSDPKALVNLLEHQGICLADFENTLSFEHDLDSVFWYDFPSKATFDAHRDAGDYESWTDWTESAERFGDETHVLVLQGTRGDFAEAQVVSGIHEDEHAQKQKVVFGCLLTLRSSEPTPGAPAAESELLRLGVELREPFVYWDGLGVLHSTSHPHVFAVVESTPEGPRLTSLFRAAHESIPFAHRRCLLVGDAEARAAERFGTPTLAEAAHWRALYEKAALAGISQASQAIARVDAACRASLRDAIAACAACAPDAPPLARARAVSALASAVASHGPSDPTANQAVRLERQRLVEVLERAATLARDGGDRFEADLLDWLALRPLGATAEDAEKESQGQSLALEWIADAHAKSALDRLRLQAVLARDATRSTLSPDFRTAVRTALSDWFAAAGHEARAKGLHATAAGSYLIADALAEAKRRDESRASLLLVSGALGGKENARGLLDLARVEGLQLLATVFPFVGSIDVTTEAWGRRVGAHEFADLLRDMPIADPRALGLDPGSAEDQKTFAEQAELLVPDVQVPLLTVSVSPSTVTDVQSTTDKEVRSGQVVTRTEHSNDAAVEAWAAEVNALAARIQSLDRDIDGARGDSARVSDTETWTSVLHGDTHTYSLTSTFESMNSAVARAQAMGRVEQLSAERDRLQARLSSLRARPPSGTEVRFTTGLVRCEIEYQHWKIKYTNEVRIEGDGAPVQLTIETTATRHYARNAASPVLGIEAADEWTSEARIRERPPISSSSDQRVVQFALRRHLAHRVDTLREAIEKSALTEEQRATELDWLTYFTTPTWKPDDPESQGQGRVVALARAHW